MEENVIGRKEVRYLSDLFFCADRNIIGLLRREILSDLTNNHLLCMLLRVFLHDYGDNIEWADRLEIGFLSDVRPSGSYRTLHKGALSDPLRKRL